VTSRIPRRASAAPIERPTPLNELALGRIRSDIVSGVFAFGERLSEEQLSSYYGFSRQPIRTARLQLQAEELIQIPPQKAPLCSPTAAIPAGRAASKYSPGRATNS
jgi:DNA-binding GntR family transcriptional regulator